MSFFERLETLNGWQAFCRPAMSYCMASYAAGAVAGLTYWLAVGRPQNPKTR